MFFQSTRSPCQRVAASGKSHKTETSVPDQSLGNGGNGFEFKMARRPELSHELFPLDCWIRASFTLPSRMILNEMTQCSVREFRTPGSIESWSQLGCTRRLAAAMYHP